MTARGGALVFAATLIVAAAGARAQTIEVPEFTVAQNGGDIEVAAGSDGNFLIAWVDYNNSGMPGNWRTYTRVYAGDGTPIAGPTRVDVNGRLIEPSVAAMPDGSYVGAFAYRASNFPYELRGRRLSSSGAGAGDFFSIDDDGVGRGSPSWGTVALTPSGPVFAWNQYYDLGRRYTLALQPLGSSFQASAGQTASWDAKIAAFPSGGFIIEWYDSFTTSVYGRVFDAAGSPRAAQFLIGANMIDERLATSATGIAAVSATWGSEVLVQRFTEDGVMLGGPTVVADIAPAHYARSDPEFDAQGNLYVLYAGFNDQSGFTYTPVWVRVLDKNTGNPLGTPTRIAPNGFYTRTARLTNGNFVNVWGDHTGEIRANIVSVCGLGSPTCGDGIIDPPCEACDDAAANSDTAPDACRTSCRLPGCGDHVTDSGEECDDGNRADDDGCDANCLVEACGNGRREAGEGCDDGNLIDGDGCDSNCTVSRCGNGILGVDEECDDGNSANGDGCDQGCLVEACGSSRIEGDEECDDGNTVDGDGCDSNCTVSRCGNGILGVDEECDDGNNVNGDGCDQVCLVEQCGNGRREGNEGCDDGNLQDADGCQADCTLTPRIDSAVLTVRPVTVVLPTSGDTATETVRVKVRNAEAAGLQILRLTASDDTCPPGTVAVAPDFSNSIGGVQDTVALGPGQRATARLQLSVSRATMAGVNRNAPRRCSIRLSVGPSAAGSIDGNASNNEALLVLDVFDRAAPAAAAEYYLRSANPVLLHIAQGNLAAQRAVHVKARATQPGATYSFAASDGDCPPGTAALVQQSATAGTATLQVRASRAFFTTPSPFSPGRCSVVITTTSQQDGDAGNNATVLSIDVVDSNDL